MKSGKSWSGKKKLEMLALSFLALNFLDMATTVMFWSMGLPEGNVLMRKLLELNPYIFAGFKISLGFLLFLSLLSLAKTEWEKNVEKVYIFVYSAINVIYAAGIIVNSIAIIMFS